MLKLKIGGINLKEYKHFTEDKEIRNAGLPAEAIIPLSQSLGKPSKPVVEKNGIVTTGQLIAEADGFISSNIHTPIPGKVKNIDYFPSPLSKRVLSIVISLEGDFKISHKDEKDFDSITPEEIRKSIRDNGIVGLGGATFPTDVKLSPPPDKKIDLLIINAAECEPYLTSDYRLMIEKTEDILKGVSLMKKALNVENAIIGIEDNKKKAYIKFRELSEKYNVAVKLIKTKYPQGGEKQLIHVLTNKKVPTGGLPMDVGIVVQNVGTAFAVKEAVLCDSPLIDRIVTISGKAIKYPSNLKVKIGTKISQLVEECGGFIEEPKAIICGGPMMGLAVDSLDIPVIKGTSGILFLTKKEVEHRKYTACLRCGRCVSACPMSLSPSKLSIFSEHENWEAMKEIYVLDCIECGCCSYVCPTDRPIVHMIKWAKNMLRKMK